MNQGEAISTSREISSSQPSRKGFIIDFFIFLKEYLNIPKILHKPTQHKNKYLDYIKPESLRRVLNLQRLIMMIYVPK